MSPDAIVEQLNEGAIAVRSSVSYTLAANAEIWSMGNSAITRGYELNNVLKGNSGHNINRCGRGPTRWGG